MIELRSNKCTMEGQGSLPHNKQATYSTWVDRGSRLALAVYPWEATSLWIGRSCEPSVEFGERTSSMDFSTAGDGTRSGITVCKDGTKVNFPAIKEYK